LYPIFPWNKFITENFIKKNLKYLKTDDDDTNVLNLKLKDEIFELKQELLKFKKIFNIEQELSKFKK
jgi:hypothetical protein